MRRLHHGKRRADRPRRGSAVALALALLLGGAPAAAQLTSANFAAVPPLLSDSAPANVMLVLSNDHELYKKAYSDYSDLDGDGLLDTSYKDDFTYIGYFDSTFCYTYDRVDERFEPAQSIADRIPHSGHRCDGVGVAGDWSGNFLNWASMTRMDIVRHVLYGGYRSTDSAPRDATPGVTVLERSFIPEDVHSFVKVFVGETGRYTPWRRDAISLCNTTYGGTNEPPLLRVAFGEWRQWSASEIVQCHYRSERNSGLNNQPRQGDGPTPHNFAARVQVCVPGFDALSERCRAYVDGGNRTYKPAGLLQSYGESGNVHFGLMTGSYNRKISGGVLRRNILPLTANADAADDEIDPRNGTFINQGSADGGIINTLNRLRIVNWSYDENRYRDCNAAGISIEVFKTSGREDRQCRNWGNPLSEIYLEAVRYFTGEELPGAAAGRGTPTAAFDVSDANQIPALPQLRWQDPLNEDNACARCAIIVLSTGLNSFDADDLGSAGDLRKGSGTGRLSVADIDQRLDDIADIEGILGGLYLVGENGDSNDKACTAKTITSLSSVRGLCPELPAMEGGFHIAGLAWHASTTDLREELEGVQNVRTFAVALAESLPSFQLDVNGKRVSFVPTCQSGSGGLKLDQNGWSDCSLSDVMVESQNANSGSFLIAWEDSHWGNDYDMDGVSRLEYCIGMNTATCPGPPANLALGESHAWSDFAWKTTGIGPDTVQFRLSVPQAAAGSALRFGYTLSGVRDGAVATALKTNTPGQQTVSAMLGNGVQSFLLRPGGRTISRLGSDSGNAIIYVEPAVYTASASTQAGALLNNPLWYTAKYGSFNDIDGDGTPLYKGSPHDTREWDVRDTRGNPGPDGIPDNFFPVSNPSELTASLSQVFEIISDRLSSGTAAAVVANSSTGLGAVYQAYYHPSYTDAQGNRLAWGGVLHAIFIDESGRLREDNGTAGRLDAPDTDFVIDIFYDRTVVPNRTRFQRYTQSDSGAQASLKPLGAPADLEELSSIWNARNVLADMDPARLAEQRAVDPVGGGYGEAAQTRRYVFTFLDAAGAGNGVVEAGEVMDFTATNFAPGVGVNHRYLGLSDPDEAVDLVNYIRGQSIDGYRNREVDIPGDGSSAVKPWLLGDIVHSSPLVVNPPGERYDILHGDATYAAFKRHYAHRRQMVYAGANDGMLHAFNGGVWESATRTFHTRAFDPGSGLFNRGPEHALGAEMWAYVPLNLLPHLQWLREPDYPHVYYVDGPAQAFDVNIFPDDAVHPGGWGTILVAGMRLGGGPFPLDLDGDGSHETVRRSAYMILDITDPERPPALLAELSLPELGYTTGRPALVKARAAGSGGSFRSPSLNQWLLVFGSGPDNADRAVSGRGARLHAYDLVARQLVTLHANAQPPPDAPAGFFGDPLVVDWNADYVDDALYVGTVESSDTTPGGRLQRVVLGEGAQRGLSTGLARMSEVIDLGQPLSARPAVQVNPGRDERWLLFGSGRLLARGDNLSTAGQAFYGVKESVDFSRSTLTAASLVDSTDIRVEIDGRIWNGDVGNVLRIAGHELPTFQALEAFMDGQPGWQRRLAAPGDSPAERVLDSPLMLGGSVAFASYTPSGDLCLVEGDGTLYALHYRTGTAQAHAPLGQEGGVAFTSVVLGQGAPAMPAALLSTGAEPTPGGTGDGGGGLTLITGSTTGEARTTDVALQPGTGGRLSWERLEITF